MIGCVSGHRDRLWMQPQNPLKPTTQPQCIPRLTRLYVVDFLRPVRTARIACGEVVSHFVPQKKASRCSRNKINTAHSQNLASPTLIYPNFISPQHFALPYSVNKRRSTCFTSIVDGEYGLGLPSKIRCRFRLRR